MLYSHFPDIQLKLVGHLYRMHLPGEEQTEPNEYDMELIS